MIARSPGFSPVLAVLWENWRLTRLEAAQRLGLGIVGGAAVMAMFASATGAFWVLLSQHALFWMSIAKLNGGRFLDGYRPGFPFHLLYPRPMPTAVFVGAAMAYDAVSGAVLYSVSAALLGFAFGKPLPVLSVAVWIVAFRLICTSVQWSTRNRVVQYLGSFGVCLPFFGLLMNRAGSPLRVEFSLAENALMASMGLASFGVAIAGVARQRRGDAVAAVPRAAAPAGISDWLINLFPFRCPTSSATRAQAWFDLKSSGLPVLAIGAALAVVSPLLFAVSIPITLFRPYAVVGAMFSGPAVLILGGNAFGIRRKQGRTYASAFEATQAYGTAELAGLKVLVRSACILAAIVAVGASVWASSSLISGWEYRTGEAVLSGPFAQLTPQVTGEKWLRGVLRLRHAIGSAIGGLTGDQLAALVVVTFIGIAVMVALRAALSALWARYRRRLIVAGWLLLLHSLALVLLTLAGRRGIASAALTNAVFGTTRSVVAAAIVLATAYLLWTSVAERLLTMAQTCSAILVSAVFGAAWVTLLRATGVPLAEIPTMAAVWMLTPVLLPLMASGLAPWSLSRVRHA